MLGGLLCRATLKAKYPQISFDSLEPGMWWYNGSSNDPKAVVREPSGTPSIPCEAPMICGDGTLSWVLRKCLMIMQADKSSVKKASRCSSRCVLHKNGGAEKVPGGPARKLPGFGNTQ